MPTSPDHEGQRTARATGAVVLLSVLCCGLPLLIAGGALAGLGSALGNPWVIGAGVALLVGVLVWRLRRHTDTSTPSGDPGCRPPQQPARDQPRQSTQSPTHPKEH
ncbi:hypothetical protein SAMN05216266_13163 [Amycolatopsis marina]|uniref:Mercuric ion transport protein n=1 Tax=Amycolatopsis marina TaxID=490629 RepID=A0A1I1CPG7_9PSEU|nr:hypothetical protein [Amycolatopsis marina]SFB62788.1 hypothetical protein SAMN05216266_13163 [Amycolatopsis marina]